jgi:hypothetical protein
MKGILTRFHVRLLLVAMATCLLWGCALPKVEVTPLTKTVYPANRGEVDLLHALPDEAFAQIARLEVNEETGDHKALLRTAAGLGADAVIMDSRKLFRDSTLTPYGAKARYRLAGTAIKYLRPEE